MRVVAVLVSGLEAKFFRLRDDIVARLLDALGGWNTDIASSSGVPGQLLRVAKTVETYWHVTSQLTSSTSAQLAAIENLAQVFVDVGLDSDNETLDQES